MISGLPPIKVLFTRNIPHAIQHFKGLLANGNLISKIEILHPFQENESMSKTEVLKLLPECNGLYCFLTDTIDANTIEIGSKLQVISTMSVGYNHIDIKACKERNIPVGFTPDVLTVTTAETAVALTFAVARKLPTAMQSAKDGTWGLWSPFQYCGQDITCSTVGIMGLGRIGAAYAKMMSRGFQCKILYCGPREKPDFAQDIAQDGQYDIQYVDEFTLLSQSDIVSMHMPLNETTKYCMNAKKLAQMKSSAILINTSRGDVIDQEALLHALKTNQIAAAGLDVTSPEPLDPKHPLFQLPNCIILPHIGSATIKTRQKMLELASTNLYAGITGQKLPHQVL